MDAHKSQNDLTAFQYLRHMTTYALYKPFGMLSQFTREVPEHVTLADVDFSFPKDVYPIGRLDSDSEGLLLLSNNKSLNKRLLHPDQKWPKTYWVQVEGIPKEKDLTPLRKGMQIRIKKKPFQTQPATVQLIAAPKLPERHPPVRFRKNIPTQWLELILVEGKNRQVRKMMAAIGFPVLRLCRSAVGGCHIFEVFGEELESGSVREIRESELI